MAGAKVDLRILKTRKAIKEAFLTLIQTKGYERITVQDIADEAIINRNTFYLHYVDKPDLLEKLCKASMEQLNVCFHLGMTDSDRGSQPIDKEMLNTVLREIFRAVEADLFFFKIMLSPNGHPHFSLNLKKTLKDFIQSGLSSHEIAEKQKIGLEYMVSGLVGVICMWIAESDQLKVEEVIGHLNDFHFTHVMNLLA